MSLIGSIGSWPQSLFNRLPEVSRPDAPAPAPGLPPPSLAPSPEVGFDQLFEQMIGVVETKQSHARTLTQSVLLGQNDQLHQSMIAMQEASVAFTLMVEVRNKLVDSYQELMRMQV